MSKALVSSLLCLSMILSSSLSAMQCDEYEAQDIERLTEEYVLDRLSAYPSVQRWIAKFFRKKMFKRVKEQCLSGKCVDSNGKVNVEFLYKEVHSAVEKTMKPLRWTTGAIIVFSTAATGYMATLIETTTPWSIGTKLALGFVTLSQAAALTYWHTPLRATIAKWSFAMFGPKLSNYSDGYIDARDRGFGSKENQMYRDISTRWQGAMDSHAISGWFRYWGFVGAPRSARGMINELAEGFGGKLAENEMRLMALKTAEFMYWARRLPGAIPFNNADVMTHMRVFLWPNLQNQNPQVMGAFRYMVLKSLQEYYDPSFRMDKPNSVAYLYYSGFMRAWKIDGTPIPKDPVDIMPPKGLYPYFDRLREAERLKKEKEGEDFIDKQAENEIAVIERQIEISRESEIETQRVKESSPETEQPANLEDPAGE